jgi:hypothetical protein
MSGKEGMTGVISEAMTLLRKALNLQEAKGNDDGAGVEVMVQEWVGKSNGSSLWT